MSGKNKLSRCLLYSYKRETQQPLFSRVCMAPFANMLFVPSGKVMACHYNRGVILGDIRSQSIKDIWNGTAINKLRENLSGRDMSYGCQACMNDLKVRNFFLAGNYKYSHIKENKNGFPSYFDFQLENTCNLKCVMCSSEYSSAIHGKPASADEPYGENFLKQLPGFIPHLRSSSFTGGEPFVIKSYFEIWKMFSEMNAAAPLYISTNASHISPSLSEILAKGNFSFTVSIDSLNAHVYESIRVNASFEKTIKNIDFLLDLVKEKKNSLSIKMVIMTNNYSELPEQIEYWSSRNVEVYPKPVWVPVSLSLRGLPSGELEKIISSYRKHQFKSNSSVLHGNINRFNSLINQLEDWKNDRALSENRSMMEKQSITFLSDMLLKNLLNTLANDYNTGIEEKDQLATECEKWIGSVLVQNSSQPEKLRNILTDFILLGPDIILAEIKRNPEKLTERFNKDISIHD